MTTCYRFDRFELRPARRQVLENGVEIDVGGRAFDLLVALVERRDRVVGRDELHALVWPNLSVELNNLHVQVWRLRNRLGDRVIRTVARQGYQFAAEIEAFAQPTSAAGVPGWFEPAHGAIASFDPGAGSVRDSSLGARLDDALGRHRLVAFVHGDDLRRRALLDAALATLPSTRRRGALQYDGALLARRGADTFDRAGTGCAPTGLPQLVRAAARARSREQLLVLQDAHLAPVQVATLVDAVLCGPGRLRVVLGTRAPLGLPHEQVLIADVGQPVPGAEAAMPWSAPGSAHRGLRSSAAALAPPLRWRSRGTPA